VLAGYISDTFGSPVAFLALAGVAAFGLVAITLIMPETKHDPGDGRFA